MFCSTGLVQIFPVANVVNVGFVASNVPVGNVSTSQRLNVGKYSAGFFTYSHIFILSYCTKCLTSNVSNVSNVVNVHSYKGKESWLQNIFIKGVFSVKHIYKSWLFRETCPRRGKYQ